MSDKYEPIRIRSNSDLCRMIAEIEGFTPQESLVVMLIQDGDLRLIARRDLAGSDAPGVVERAIDTLLESVPGADARFVVYTQDHLAGWNLLSRCTGHLPPGIRTGVLLVDGDTWHEPDGRLGNVYSDPPGGVPAERANSLGPGRGVDPRDGLESAPETPELVSRLIPVLDGLPEVDQEAAVIARTVDLLSRNLPAATDAESLGAAGVNAEDAFGLAMLSHHRLGRDIAALAITQSSAKQHLQLWRAVVTQTPSVVSEMPLFLAGMAAWISGDRAMAVSALHRAQAAAFEESPRPSRLLATLLEGNISHADWAAMRAGVLGRTDPRIQLAVASLSTQPAWETINQQPLGQRPQPPQRPPSPGIPR